MSASINYSLYRQRCLAAGKTPMSFDDWFAFLYNV